MANERAFLTAKKVRADSFPVRPDGPSEGIEVFEVPSQPRYLARLRTRSAASVPVERWAAATRLLVTLRPEVGDSEAAPLLRKLTSPGAPDDGRLRVTRLPLPRLHLVEWSSDAAPVGPDEERGFLLSRVEEISRHAAVERAGEVRTYFKIPAEPRVLLLAAPAEPESELQQMRVAKAWGIEEGDREIRVAVMDTGVDIAHQKLRDNLYTVNGKLVGWSFNGNGTDFRDDNGHGTFCAGLIGASGGLGVNKRVSIIPIKFMNADGYGMADAAIRGIQFALEQKAHVISCSWGAAAETEDLDLKKKIEQADDQGVLFVAGAGNGGEDLDHPPAFYPAAFSVPNVISVGACDDDDQPVTFGGHGKQRVHLTAPGATVYSTTFGNGVTQGDGTSASAAFVAGACALVMATLKKSNQPWDHMTVRKRIIQSVAPLKGDANEIEQACCSKGRLDVGNAVLGQDLDQTLNCP